jgi:hypothetical protein
MHEAAERIRREKWIEEKTKKNQGDDCERLGTRNSESHFEA